MADGQASGLWGWFEEHPIALIVGGIVIVFLVVPQVLKMGQQASGTSSQLAGSANNTNADLTGLSSLPGTGQSVYVPTQTIFTTNNRTVGSNVNSPNSSTATSSVSAPAATTVTVPAPVAVSKPVTVTTPVSVSTPIMVTTTGSVNNVSPTSSAPPRQGTPTPHPPVNAGHLVWNQNYTIKHGDTLSAIASRVTVQLHSQGMPQSLSVSYNDIYSHNQGVINATANKHGNPIKGFATPQQLNNIFPGELITLPVWSKS